jgi:glycosyltransferase involved in cell wall biosynthesis
MEELGIDGTTISTFPMGIEENFLNEGMKRERRSNGQSLTILSNRNLLPPYNVSLLVRAIPHVLHEEPGAKFLIAGNGSEKGQLEREAVALKVNPSVQFLGRVPHERMADLLAQADVYVSTSLHDGTSVSLLEAMAAGTFPVVTDIPANREWIKDGQNGFLVSTRDEKLLARKIVDALRNRELLQKSRASNFAVVKESALWASVIKRTKEFYSEILGSKN